MLSGSIDLTNNRVFGSSRLIEQGDVGIELIGATHHGQNKSIGDYEKLMRYERTFGTKSHDNSFEKIFHREILQYKLDENICERCGKPLRLPWKRVYCLCEECNEQIKITINHVGKYYPWSVPTNSRDSRDILNVR